MADSIQSLVTRAQRETLEPERFQRELIAGLTRALLRQVPPPCLLRAPTGSGKTFILARVLANISAEENVVWFWFVPYVNLVAQTLDALVANTADLSPQLLEHGRNQEPQPGQVLISTAQAVARAQWRKQGYNADSDDDTRTLAEMVNLARERKLRIGLVVDEAHIALDKETEFGQFARWLNPDYLLMATATPKDQRLNDFLAIAGKSGFENFQVSRDDVVQARLNKRYIEAIVYDLRESVRTIADLEKTVLQRAWQRIRKLKRDLSAAGIELTPLLLVQVANGDKTVETAERALIELCKVPPQVIGKHTAADPDPGLMTAIANDRSKEVLIFKQSAGTGFDAPRAFVLASVKPVNDPDFAMQFIGRIMRVAVPIRRKYGGDQPIPPDFDTAFIYLANAEAQGGFDAAVRTASTVKSELEGQTEKLEMKKTASGAIVITNRPVPQVPLSHDMPLPNPTVKDGKGDPIQDDPPPYGTQHDFFAGVDDRVEDEEEVEEEETVISFTSEPNKKPHAKPGSEEEVFLFLEQHNVRAYRRRRSLACVPERFKREERPVLEDMSELSRAVAARLEIPEKTASDAVKAAMNRLRETERHTELTQGAVFEEQALVITDRNALAKEARALMHALPQVEDEDCAIIQKVIADRVKEKVMTALEEFDEEQRDDPKAVERFARDAANWIIRKQIDLLAEGLFAAIADKAKIVDTPGRLPDAMVFPADLPLTQSSKNIYGVLPPTEDVTSQVSQSLLIDDRSLLKSRNWLTEEAPFQTAEYDGSSTLNKEELAFAKALDRSGFVHWWHRNPDRKPYSVQLTRGEHKNYFYPDFIVCLSHYPGDELLMRLVETKENVKDAARKAKHLPEFYGKVLFLTRDQNRWRWVKDDGSLGNSVDLDDLQEMQEWLRLSRPADSQD